MSADVLICGLGLCPPDDVLPRTERALRRVNEVLFVDTGPATAAWLAARCPVVTPLFAEVYAEGRPRAHSYRRMAARTVAAALDHAPVAFAMSGHPLVGALAPFLIRALCGPLGLSVEVHPGLSSLDALFADLWLDPFVHGLLVLEASDVLLRARPLPADVPLLLTQVGNLGSGTFSTAWVDPALLRRLVDRLLATHPPDHVVSVVYSSPHPLVPTARVDLPLAGLVDRPELLHPGVTVWVPAAAARPIVAEDLAIRLRG